MLDKINGKQQHIALLGFIPIKYPSISDSMQGNIGEKEKMKNLRELSQLQERFAPKF